MLLVFVFGSGVPFVLRKAPAVEEWQHITTAYILPSDGW
jgi:hypothetical protein